MNNNIHLNRIYYLYSYIYQYISKRDSIIMYYLPRNINVHKN